MGATGKKQYFFLLDVNVEDGGLEVLAAIYVETDSEASVEEKRPKRRRETKS